MKFNPFLISYNDFENPEVLTLKETKINLDPVWNESITTHLTKDTLDWEVESRTLYSDKLSFFEPIRLIKETPISSSKKNYQINTQFNNLKVYRQLRKIFIEKRIQEIIDILNSKLKNKLKPRRKKIDD